MKIPMTVAIIPCFLIHNQSSFDADELESGGSLLLFWRSSTIIGVVSLSMVLVAPKLEQRLHPLVQWYSKIKFKLLASKIKTTYIGMSMPCVHKTMKQGYFALNMCWTNTSTTIIELMAAGKKCEIQSGNLDSEGSSSFGIIEVSCLKRI